MFIVKCDACGFEQVVKKRLDSDVYEALKHNNGLYCDRRVCDGMSQVVPGSFKKTWGIFGGWTVVQPMDLETYKSVKRAKKFSKWALLK